MQKIGKSLQHDKEQKKIIQVSENVALLVCKTALKTKFIFLKLKSVPFFKRS